MSGEVVRELLTILGFDTNETGFKRSEEKFNSLIALSAELVSRVERIGSYFFGLAAETAKAGEQAYLTGQKLGITAEQVQELTYAADQSGVAFGSIQDGMRQITSRANEALNGNKAMAKTFRDLGIQIAGADGRLRPSIDLFKEATARIGRMTSASEKLAATRKIAGRGGDSLIPLINEGADALEKYAEKARRLGIIDEETAKKGDDFGDSLGDINWVLNHLKQTIGAKLMPVIHEMMDALLEWYSINRDLIHKGISQLAKALIACAKIARPFVSTLAKLATTIIENSRVIIIFTALLGATAIGLWAMTGGLAAAVVGMTTLASMAWILAGALWTAFAPIIAPILAVVAAAALLALVIEDIYVYLTGGESLIGEFFDTFLNKPIDPEDHWMVKTLHHIARAMKHTINGVGISFTELFTLVELFSLKELIDQVFTDVFDGVVIAWKATLGEFFGWLGEKAKDVPLLGRVMKYFESEEAAKPQRNASGQALSHRGLPLGSGPATEWNPLAGFSGLGHRMTDALPATMQAPRDTRSSGAPQPAPFTMGDLKVEVHANTKEGVNAQEIADKTGERVNYVMRKAGVKVSGQNRGRR